MATYDVRNDHSFEEIVFAEDDTGPGWAYFLSFTDGRVRIEDSMYEMTIANRRDAENLIKALEKAISLGWLK